jgi:hypothetical protein
MESKEKKKKNSILLTIYIYISVIYQIFTCITGLQHVFFSHGAPIINQTAATVITCLLSRELTRKA